MQNIDKYREFCKQEKDIPIFSKDWWLDTVCGKNNWDVIIYEKGGNIVATMPYFLQKKYFMTLITQPILTQTLGIYIKYPENQKYYKKLSLEKEVIENIVKLFPKFDKYIQQFNYAYTNLLPFYWAGFDIKVRYTYIIDKNINMETLRYDFLTEARRRRIKKAEKIGIKVYESDNIKKFYELNQLTFKRQGKKIPYSLDFIKRLYFNCTMNGACKILLAKYNNKVVAGSFLVYDNQTVYYLMGGIDPEKKDIGAMDMIQYESIKFALDNNKIFDFEGSMLESIEKYFRSFGAIQKPYFQITKIDSKLLKIKDCLKDFLK